jgi:hypothetical protein
MSSPSSSEAEVGDTISGTTSCFCASGSYMKLTDPFESPVKFLCPVFCVANRVPVYMEDKPLTFLLIAHPIPAVPCIQSSI